MVLRGFFSDRCNLQASALTYFTLMSLVPLLALGLSLARVFGAGDLAREMISQKIAEFCGQISSSASADAEMAAQFAETVGGYADRVFEAIGNISFGTLGAVGLVTLLWMAIAMLNQVEQSFNSVWRAPPRKMWRKVADYIAIIVVVPFLAIAASSLPVVAKFAALAEGGVSGLLGPETASRVVRFCSSGILTVALFTVVLVFVPNTRVRMLPGLGGGLATAIAFAVWFKLCTALQLGVAKYSRVYGGFAALPILLAWTYVSWQIMLFGAELTLALQRHESFIRDQGADTAGGKARGLLALAIVSEMARRMAVGEKPLDVAEYARVRGISDRLALGVAKALASAGLVAETVEEDDGDSYTLLRSPEKLTVGETLLALFSSGTPVSDLGLDNVDPEVKARFDQICADVTSTLSTPIAVFASQPSRNA